MDDLVKLRGVGLLLCTVVLAGLSVVMYSYWAEWSESTESTTCGQWEMMYEWELGQNGLWMTSVAILLWVMVKPEMYRSLLMSLYLLGPVFFIWTAVGLFSFSSFRSCCMTTRDSCLHFSSYQGASLVYGQMLVSLLMSGLLSLVLFCILACIAWSYLDKRIQESVHRLHSPAYALIV